MTKNYIISKGATYILIAVLCITNLFLGAQVISKLTTIKDTVEINKKEKVITVFNQNNYISDNSYENLKENDNIIIKDFEENTANYSQNRDTNLFLRILTYSNAYMKTVYEIENGGIDKSSIDILNIFSSLSNPDFYLSFHLPAIVSAFNDSFEIKRESEEENKDDVIVLSDIVFIEDPEERNDLENELEQIENRKEDELPLEKPDAIALDNENPYILIYHTHGTEAYLPITSGRFHTEQREYNVITIGEIISEILTENGHRVKHVDIYHDIPSYNQSYARSLSTVKDELKNNESIKVIFDIHRDGIEGDLATLEKVQEAARISINGKSVATFSMVIGPDNPNKEELLKFANYIKHVSDSMYPGLCKGIIIKPSGKFNQYVSDYYALLEVGSNLNNIDEAKESAKYIGKVLHEVLERINNE